MEPPLEKAIRMWHQKLTGVQEVALRESLQALAQREEVSIGTGFSGCEVIHKVFTACERDEEKQQFIRREFPDIAVIFRDIGELGNTRAFDVVSSSYRIVPYVQVWFGGFVCGDSSSSLFSENVF